MGNYYRWRAWMRSGELAVAKPKAKPRPKPEADPQSATINLAPGTELTLDIHGTKLHVKVTGTHGC